ncbi:hypothetical protein [Mastigocoleus sp. MO_188.B34]|nr:hypothetical protein [Mastigocoleus sp. MO_188.B34]MDJ0693767.1 hypothetical protein [Mastigocoleus sp. MO_188.B34]
MEFLSIIEEDNLEDKASKEATIKLVAAFSVATKLHLLGEAINKELA